MKKTKCPSCKGSTFLNVEMSRGKYKVECICGHTFEGTGGIYVDVVVGQMKMEF